MNILQVLPELNVGGVETGTVDFAKYLVNNGHKSVVVSNGGDLVKDLEDAKVVHYKLPVHRKSIVTILEMIKKLSEIIKNEKIDIVHARSRVPAWISFFACRNTGATFMTTCHGYYSEHFFSKVMGWPKLVIVPSNVIGRHMIDDFSVPYQRIRLIPRSVDLKKFSFQPYSEKSKTEFIIGIIGRITPLKGHAYFLKAVAKVIRSMPYLKVWVVGDAPENKQIYKEEVQTLARRLGLSHCVKFLGRRKDIPQIIAKLNLVVLSTVTEEAFGRVIVEAQAAGVPVVATRVGGVVDIIEDGKTGILVPPKDADAMASAIIKVLKDRTGIQKITQKARKNVEERFNLERMCESTIKVYEEAVSTKNILMIKISAIGDVILSVPSIRAIKNKFPQAKIYCLVGKESKQILHNCPYLNGLIVYDREGKHKGIKGILDISKELRKYNFDLVVDLQNNRSSHIISFLSMSPERFGYDNGKFSFLLNHKVKQLPIGIPPVEHQFRTLKLLGIQDKDVELELWPSKENEDHVKGLLDSYWVNKKERIVGINLCASKKWVTKCWPIEKFAQLCNALSNENIRVVVTGTKDEAGFAEKLQEKTSSKLLIFSGKTTLMQLVALIKRCNVFITGDSAPLHIAAAAGVSVVALFGPTSPERHMPPAKNAMVIRKDLNCSPCYKPQCRKTECMSDIGVAEVFQAVKNLISLKNN
ncbi:MAG: lipopolysaccharide heptosyltransferase II [Candidatus Omnitrophota bacterium]